MAGDQRENFNQDVNRNLALTRFFDQYHAILEGYSIGYMSHKVKRNVATMFHTRLLWNDDWKEILNDMGLTNVHEITNIEAASMVLRELPLFLIMDRILAGHSINILINIMRNMQRFDVLNYLQDYIRDALAIGANLEED